MALATAAEGSNDEGPDALHLVNRLAESRSPYVSPQALYATPLKRGFQ